MHSTYVPPVHTQRQCSARGTGCALPYRSEQYQPVRRTESLRGEEVIQIPQFSPQTYFALPLTGCATLVRVRTRESTTSTVYNIVVRAEFLTIVKCGNGRGLKVIQYSIAKEKEYTNPSALFAGSDLIERQQIGNCLQYVSLIVDS